MGKIILQLEGGLGNQMFQYAAGMSAALSTKSELVVDRSTGFLLDQIFRRKYELNRLGIAPSSPALFLAFPFLLRRVLKKAGIWPYLLNSLERNHLWRDETSEHIVHLNTKHAFYSYNPLHLPDQISILWMTGYWQSHKYFTEHNNLILKQFYPRTPDDNRFRQLGQEMSRSNSVSVGIRLYEESKAPQNHAFVGKLKSYEELRDILVQINSELGRPCFYIFSTYISLLPRGLFDGLRIKYVSHEEGFSGSAERLWLFAQANNYLFTNSSFYWWGAWLGSHASQFPQEKKVFCSDNFINRDCIPDHWRVF